MIRLKDYKKLMMEDIYKRKDMPQVSHRELKKAIKILLENGIKVKKGKGLATDWKPSQKDIYKAKVDKILKRTDSPKGMKPFIISRDNYIVDGHHRWAAMLKKYPKEKFEYYKIDLPIQQAVEVYNKVAEKV